MICLTHKYQYSKVLKMSDEIKSTMCDCGWCKIEEWIDNNNTNVDVNLLTRDDTYVSYRVGQEEKYNGITNDIIKEFWHLHNELNDKKMLKQNKHYHTHRGEMNVDLHIIPSYMKGYRKFHLIISK